jgi:hypothetical protein
MDRKKTGIKDLFTLIRYGTILNLHNYLYELERNYDITRLTLLRNKRWYRKSCKKEVLNALCKEIEHLIGKHALEDFLRN